jgi:hypothetical protein
MTKPMTNVMLSKGVRTIATEFGVPNSYKTINNLAAGRHAPMSAFNASKQKLKPAEECAVVDHILGSARCGFSLTLHQIKIHVNAILEQRFGSDYNKDKIEHQVGKVWVHNFIDRHNSKLQTHWACPPDTQCAQALNPNAVHKWFELVEHHVVLPNVQCEDVYGMDESGFPPGNQGVQRVVGGHGTKTQH